MRSSATVLAGSLLVTGAIPAASVAAPKAPAIPKAKQVPFKRAEPGKPVETASFAKYAPTAAAKLPAATTALVDLSGTGKGAVLRAPANGKEPVAEGFARAGNLPVLVGKPHGTAKSALAKGGGGELSRVRVTSADQSVAQAAGVHGVLFSLEPADTSAGSGEATVVVDPSSFRAAFGGDYASRLHLVQLPSCALTTPDLATCQVQTPLPTEPGSPLTTTVTVAPAKSDRVSFVQRNSLSAGPVAAPASSGAMVLAATSSADGSSGSYSATSLSPAGAWSAGGSTGAFAYAYPIKVPKALAGASPDVSLSYDSSSQDGRTAGTNNQSSWLGDGWSSGESFVERSYKLCAGDTGSGAPQGSGDRCWAGQVLTLSLNGKTTQIVYDGTSFRPASDSSTEKVERLFLSGGASNGTYNGEYFRVTENGVQYYFGLNQLPGFAAGKQETKSVFTMPVYGARTDEPCHGASFASSSCTQGWRWNLDYTVDLHDNATAYYYQPETNYYGANAQNTGVAYTRGGYLQRIDYGMTASTVYSATAPQQVVFDVTERCIPGTPAGATCADGQFTTANAAWWPDVPTDQHCGQGASCTNHGPSFWSRKRLSRITTQVQVGGATQQVDKWDFVQSFPDGGDHAPTLWLDSVQRTGLDTSAGGGAAVALPVTSFDPPAQKPNRVGTITNQPAMYHNRIQNIVTETGAQITVTYNPTECTPANVPSDPTANTMACYPFLWTPPGYTTQQKDWFHKYTVASVRTDDLHTQNQDGTYPSMLTSYKYLGGAAWHYDESELGKADARTYSQFRGYATVETRSGDTRVLHTNNNANVYDQLTLSKTTYFRGMSHNTADGTGGTSVSLTSQDGAHSYEDRNELAGRVFETANFNGDGGALEESTVTIPTIIGPTATRNRTGLRPLTAQIIRDSVVYKRHTTSYGWRNTETDTFYNTSLGQPTTGMVQQVADRGEIGAAGNTPQCTWTKYLSNPAKALVVPVEVVTNAQDCPTAGASPTGDLVSDIRTSYDGNGFAVDGSGGAAPVKADATLVESANASTGASATSFLATARTTYDGYGRALTVTRTPNSTAPDGSSLAQTVSTTYTPAAGALPTSVATKTQVTAGATPTYQTSRVDLAPARNQPITKVDISGMRTDLTYDALGRLTNVWLPTQSKAANQSPSARFSYALSNTTASAVTSEQLLENGSYSSTVALYDAMLRLRQKQAPGENSSTNVSDTQYDSHGWTVRTNNAYNIAGSPAPVVAKVAQLNVPASTVTEHDAMGRATQVSEEHNGVVTPGMVTTTAYTGDSTVVVPRTGGVTTRAVTDARGRTVELGQYTSAPSITGSALSGFTATGGVVATTKYGFNAAGQQISVTGPDQVVWQFAYDLQGHQTKKVDPDAGTARYVFDDAGNQVATIDVRNVELNYTYDLLGRKLTAVDKTNGSFKFGVWKYDTLQAGKLTYSARYVPGTTGAYVVQPTGYTSLGKPTGTKITLPASEAPLPTSYTTSYTYSPTTQQLIGQRDPGVAGLLSEDISYGYNVVGNAVSMQGVNAYVGPVAYTNYGEPAQITYGPSNNPAWSTYSYDDQTRRLTNVQTSRNQAPGPVIDDISYTYDASGNTLSAVDKQSETGTAVTDTQCYQYDALNRLTQAWTASGTCPAAGVNPTSASVATGPAAYWQSFGYDVIGNRVSSVDHAVNGQAGDTTTAYTNGCTGNSTQCPNGPQPHTLTGTSTTGPGGTTTTSFSYDAMGSIVGRTPSAGPAQALHWDSEGRVDQITQGGTTVAKFVYDADGNQLIRRDPGQTTLHAGDTEIVVNTSATPNVLLGAVRTYSLAGKAVALASSLPGGGVHYVLSDPHNTATLTIDTTTQKAVRKQYTPYGQNRGTATGWPDPTRGFLAKPFSGTTGYTDVGARKYDAALGRFLSIDPVFSADDPQQLGGYTYAGGNPVTKSDPSGLRIPDDDRSSGGGGSAYKPFSWTNLHNWAVEVVASYLTTTINVRYGLGNSWRVTTDIRERATNTVPEGSDQLGQDKAFPKLPHMFSGGPGYVDIMSREKDAIYVWEVKNQAPDFWDGGLLTKGGKARAEYTGPSQLDQYIKKMTGGTGMLDGLPVKKGYYIPPMITWHPTDPELTMVVGSISPNQRGENAGIITYRTYRTPLPDFRPVPAPALKPAPAEESSFNFNLNVNWGKVGETVMAGVVIGGIFVAGALTGGVAFQNA
ncbi:RHS repeat-associated core domain-containing protein [Streptomyces sp. NPDC054956]